VLASLIPRNAGDFWIGRTSELIPVYDTKADVLTEMPLETYVACAVAAEMPASYEPEALKAQAVAARTRAIAGHCVRYPHANVCTDSQCCQAYNSEEAQREKWGESYEKFRKKISEAVSATAGEIMTYDSEPILVLYHAVSGGMTEDVELVFSRALPYLRGVDSPGEEEASRYESRQTFDRKSFTDRINAAYRNAGLTPDSLEEQVEIVERSVSGRVLRARLGGAYADGRSLRSTLGLFSANFSFAFTAESVVIDQRGYGHGVGMSQAGAQAMAKSGADYMEILLHYYTGVEVTLF